MAEIEEKDVGVQERVRCSCGSEIMLKNMKAHTKTLKHQNGGKVSRVGLTRDTFNTIPAQVSVKDTCLDERIYKKIPPEEQKQPKPKKAVKFEDNSHDESDEEDFETIVLADLQTLGDRMDRVDDRMDEILNLLNAGFGALLGNDLETLEEGDEKDA
jgi:hypothetical protein